MEKAVLAAARVDHLAWDVPVQAELVLVNRYPTGNQNFGRSVLGCVETEFGNQRISLAAFLKLYNIDTLLHRSKLSIV